MRTIVESDDPEETNVLGSEDLTPDNPADLFTESSLNQEFQPDPVHVFRLWQIFLERVNPLMKVIHAPSMQSYVMDAASNITKLPLKYQALLYAILNLATIALTSEEALQMLSVSRETAISQFSSAFKSSLIRYNFLRNYDMTALQALLLYIVWLGHSPTPSQSTAHLMAPRR